MGVVIFSQTKCSQQIFFPLKRVVGDTDGGSNFFSDQMLTANFPSPTLLCQVVPSLEQSSCLFTSDFMASYFAFNMVKQLARYLLQFNVTLGSVLIFLFWMILYVSKLVKQREMKIEQSIKWNRNIYAV